MLGALLLSTLAVGGCGRSGRHEAGGERPVGRGGTALLPVHVLADTGRGGALEVPLGPGVRVWLSRVSPTPLPPPSPPLPSAAPDSVPALEDSPPALEVDPGLKPPILRVPGVLGVPSGRRARGFVELQVKVDETGAVSGVTWTGGSSDTALVGAARRCALGMRFYPALRDGRPVAVWCEQRFDFGAQGR